jgi:ribosomal protein S18 acetylase RimI-like enzyme
MLPAYTLRPAADADYEYLYRLNEATMRVYREQVYGPWDEAFERRRLADHFRPDSTRILVIDGRDAGMIDVRVGETSVNLANIRIAPEYQGRGLGSHIVRGVLQDAHQHGRSVTLSALKVNPARRLYERLGFVVVSETATHFVMESRPPSPTLPPPYAARVPEDGNC